MIIVSECALKVEVLIGKGALRQIEEEEFLADWEELYHSCPWATPYQSREYVCSWYKLYQKDYTPIIIRRQENGRLTGLLTLALPPENANLGQKFIVAAGNFDADYQTWLTNQDDDGAFIKSAIQILWGHFPQHDLMLKYIPQQAPLSWIESDSFWKRHCALQAFSCPVVDVAQGTISKHSRKRINRITRQGTFERITDMADFLAVFNELAYLFDFRQGAMFNKNPFRDDPANRELLLSLFSQGLLHVTVLKIKHEIIAAVAATIRQDRVYLAGINCHSPFYAEYSPGYVHFLLLGQLLAGEGYECFDLTPGYDGYKERLATRHEKVHQMVVTRKQFYYLKRKVRSWMHERMVQVGVRPLGVELELKKRIYLVRRKGIAASLATWLKSNGKESNHKLYMKDAPCSYSDTSILLHKNSLRDLLDFEQHDGKLTRWEFLESAMRRFEQGEYCYSWAESGRLLACAWVGAIGQPEGEDAGCNEKANRLALKGLYCHAAGREKLTAFLKTVAAKVAAEGEQCRIYALATEPAICLALEKAEFRLFNTKQLL